VKILQFCFRFGRYVAVESHLTKMRKPCTPNRCTRGSMLTLGRQCSTFGPMSILVSKSDLSTLENDGKGRCGITALFQALCLAVNNRLLFDGVDLNTFSYEAMMVLREAGKSEPQLMNSEDRRIVNEWSDEVLAEVTAGRAIDAR
jgi:hypothetical protein